MFVIISEISQLFFATHVYFNFAIPMSWETTLEHKTYFKWTWDTFYRSSLVSHVSVCYIIMYGFNQITEIKSEVNKAQHNSLRIEN
jgi:hypothetical protein